MPPTDKRFEELLECWGDLIRSCFAHAVDVRLRQLDGDFMIAIDWPLNDGRLRLNLRSRQFVLILSEDVLSQYADSSEVQRLEAGKMLRKLLKEGLSDFNPKHGFPPYQPPPIAAIRIGAKALFIVP